MAGAPATLRSSAAWRAVYKDLRVIYTGGVTLENVSLVQQHDPDAIICASALTAHIDDPTCMVNEAQRWRDIMDARDGRRAEAASTGTPRKGDSLAVATFGEIMLRLSPPQGERFTQAASLDVAFGGSEANVAVALAGWDIDARVITALPSHALGDAAIAALRARGVDTSHVIRSADRLGVYFLEHGASQRPSKVIYDRAESAIARLQPGEIVWEAVLSGARWLHVSGITPALSPTTAELTLEALRIARAGGLTTSIDINYRARLWSRSDAGRVIGSMMDLIDICFANEADAADVFGIRAADTDLRSGKVDLDAYRDVAAELVNRFELKLAAISLRESISASDNAFSACCFDGENFHRSRRHEVHLVDRVGGGDAFAAGVIYGLLHDQPASEALERGVAASVLQQTVHGDFALISMDEVDNLLAGDTSGRIQR